MYKADFGVETLLSVEHNIDNFDMILTVHRR